MMEGYSLILEKFSEYFIEEDGELKQIDALPNVNDINILIGTNNSGKSRFMRKLMKVSNYLYLSEEFFKKANNEIDDLNNNRHSYSYDNNITKPLLRNVEIKNSFEYIKTNKRIFKRLNYSDLIIEKNGAEKVFIPTLRTAHSLFLKEIGENGKNKVVKIEEDIFLNTIQQNYSEIPQNEYGSVEIFTGMHLYKEILNARNAKRDKRDMFYEFEKFISENFFAGKSVDIIAEFDKDESRSGNNTKEIISIHIEGEKESRDIFQLGDGIQALIILLYKIFMADEGTCFFIDEPEINLHPGMQRLFLQQITSNPVLKEKKLKYFISTHSNHFLDLTIEQENVSIYSFSAKIEDDGDKKLVIRNVNRGDNRLLREIGVNNSAVFMANCSIWVEGISDRNYIKAFLQSYCEHIGKPFPKEDIDFAFFEYAGSNIDHYFFESSVDDLEQRESLSNDIKALALSNRIFLLADSDDAQVGSAKHSRLEKLLAVKSDNFVPKILDTYREIENLLPIEIWKKVLINFCNDKIVKEKGKEAIQSKIDTALNEIKITAYKKKYIGEFLNEVRNLIGKEQNTFILNASEYKKSGDNFGTLQNKRKLSEIVLQNNFDWEVLAVNKDIAALTEDIYDFILRR